VNPEDGDTSPIGMLLDADAGSLEVSINGQSLGLMVWRNIGNEQAGWILWAVKGCHGALAQHQALVRGDEWARHLAAAAVVLTTITLPHASSRPSK
jgi:hypothetical protein